jgi:hypothetical protein
MRNEKILQLIGYYYSINGDINYLHDQLIDMNSIIDELFTYTTMNNIYLILYDKNLTPAQMVNNFKNYDANKYDDILNKEDEIKNLKDYIQILNKQREEIHNEFATFCKDKFEVKQKYNIISGNDNDKIVISKKHTSLIRVGKLAKKIIPIIKSEKFDNNELDSLLAKDRKKREELFGLSYPALVKSCDIFDRERYYMKEKIRIKDAEYYLCSQWYERNRSKLLDWLNNHK